MLTESVVIILVLVVAMLTCLKSKQRENVLLIVPFLAVPLFYLISAGIGAVVPQIPVGSGKLAIIFVVLGGLVGSGVSFVFSHFLGTTHGKRNYTIFGIVLTLALMIAYLVNLLR